MGSWKHYKGTTGGLDVVLKNIVYDFYSKDLSMKVTTAKRAKMRKGEAGGGHIPFGYVRSTADRRKYEIDPEAAKMVRKLFDLAIEGKKTSEIARILNEDRIPTPGQYYRKKHPGTKRHKNLSDKISWTVVMLNQIIRNDVHYGAMVGHKREQVAVCSKVTRSVERSKRVIIPGMHEGIVTKEEWEKAQECFRKVNYTFSTSKRKFLLRSVCKCGYCERALQYYPRKKGDYFICQASRLAVDASCTKGKMMVAPVNAAVLESIKGMVKCGKRFENKLEKKMDSDGAKAEKRMKELSDLQRAVWKCQADLFQNSERQMDGLIDITTYQKNRERLN